MNQRRDDIEETPEHSDAMSAKKAFARLLHRLQQLPPHARARLQGRFAQQLVDATLAVDTPRGPVSFVLLGRTAAGRAMDLLTKQPGTIAWIDSFLPNSVFWDVGANIGIYTLYAGLRADIKVVAFEPAGINYFLLAANCEANHLDDRVDCLLVGLGRERAIARLEASQFDSAKSFSFHPQSERQNPSRQAALVLSMDELIDEFGLGCPNYIKIDAPGMAEAIIAGGARMLQRPDVRELHIEVREETKIGRRIIEALMRSGFAVAGRHAHGHTADLTFRRT